MKKEETNLEEKENLESEQVNNNQEVKGDVVNENINDTILDEEVYDDKSISIDRDELFKLQKKLKNSYNKNVILSIFCIICVIIFLLEGVLIYFIYQKNIGFINMINNSQKEEEIATKSTAKRAIDMDKFVQKLSFIEYLTNNAFYYEKDSKKVEDSMLNGYVEGLNDRYAQYFPKQEYQDFKQTATGEYYGIGAVCTQKFETMEATITEVYEGSPAEKAGLKVGDIFKEVEGTDVSEMELSEIVTLIKGEEGTPVKIKVLRKDENKMYDITAYRGKVEIKAVSSQIYEDNIGYIKVNEFTGKAFEQFKTQIDDLQNKNVKGIMIDLRNNPGGELTVVLSMVDYIMRDNDGKFTLNQKETAFDVGKTLVVYMKDKHTIVESYYCDDGHEINTPLVILVNENSASASELFTRCLMDYGKVQVVGTRTFGKGVVQNMIPLEDGSAIKFTVSEYFTPSGYSIDHHGVIPDYCLDNLGDELVYDKDGNLIEQKKATSSEIKKSKDHVENKKIYDEENDWLDSEWFGQMDVDYTDKQLLQGIILLK